MAITPTGSGSNRRRSQRVFVQVPVTVDGESPDRKKFHEETQTLAVNAHGCLVSLAARVAHGQSLTLTNKTTKQNLECKVVFLGPSQSGKAQIGIEFKKPSPNFWHIAFPPDDWRAVPD